MDTDIYIIIRAVNNFIDGLFFGFAILMLLALLASVLSRNKHINKFIHHAIVVARVLAIVYFVLYLISLVFYYGSGDFTLFSKRATGPYAYAYWFSLLRPLTFCGLIQLYWFKKIRSKLRFLIPLTFLIAILTLFSGAMFEKLVIINASYHRGDWSGDSRFEYEFLLIIALHIIEKCVLFSALVFGSWAIFKAPKLE
nr:hypothetical protein [uncultured Psychroserpens sp.]